MLDIKKITYSYLAGFVYSVCCFISTGGNVLRDNDFLDISLCPCFDSSVLSRFIPSKNNIKSPQMCFFPHLHSDWQKKSVLLLD